MSASVTPGLSLDTSNAPPTKLTVAIPASVMTSSSTRDDSPSGKTIFSESRIICQSLTTHSIFPILCCMVRPTPGFFPILGCMGPPTHRISPILRGTNEPFHHYILIFICIDTSTHPQWFMQAIRQVKAYQCRSLLPPLWRFSFDNDAAIHNAKILQRVDFDLHRAISMQAASSVAYGSEFKPVHVLEPLIGRHPLWSAFRSILEHGATYPLRNIDDTSRSQDIHDAIARGNHKSAIKNFDLIKSMMTTEVEFGYALPIPIDTIHQIPQAAVAPLGIVFQDTIDESGNVKEKARVTHDQSFPFSSGLPVNVRVIQDQLIPCQYGHCLSRMLHYIAAARSQFPNVRILIGKVDWRTAYRRAHLAGSSAAECITILGDIALVALRLTFGGTPCPSLWCTISELCTDLANDILACDDWDPREIQSAYAHMIPPPCFLDDDVPFAPAKPLQVDVPVSIHGKVDCYVDDIGSVCLDLRDNVERCRQAVPLAIDLLGRPIDSTDSLPRDDLVAVKKLLGEGQMAECKIFTGWLIDTRRMLVSLPFGKFSVWSESIQSILQTKQSCQRDLAKLIGRLNHTCFIIPHARHFISRLRHFADGLHSARRLVSLPPPIIADLRTWLEFLTYASNGISINNIVFREPTHEFCADACEYGIGGFSKESGKGWQWRLPVDMIGVVSINALEFVANVVNVWMAQLGHIADLPPLSCVLSSTDSTSAAAWLHKSSFADSKLFEQAVARKLAQIMLSADSSLYSQWVAGSDNGIADALSRVFDLDEPSLTAYIYQKFSVSIQLIPLPQEISLWMTLLLRHARSGLNQSPPEQIRRQPQHGVAGHHTSAPSASLTTTSSNPSLSTNACRSSSPSQQQSAVRDSPQALPNSRKALSTPPSTMWHRCSGQTIGAILD